MGNRPTHRYIKQLCYGGIRDVFTGAGMVLAKFWTKQGLGRLGGAIRAARESQGSSLGDIVDLVFQRTGYKLSKKTIGNVENNVGEPKYNTLVAIAAAGFVLNPAKGKPFTEDEFNDIAAEVLDPFTGQYCQSGESCLSHNRTRVSQSEESVRTGYSNGDYFSNSSPVAKAIVS